MKRNTFLIIVSAILILTSCEENTNTPGKPQIIRIIPDSSYIGSEITIYGINLGLPSPNSYVILPNNIKISSLNCIKWNDSFIKLIIPKGTSSGNVYIIVGSDTTNSIFYKISKLPTIELVEISAGTFQMGSATGLSYELPVHSVTITKPFLISKYEISQQIWSLVTDTNPSIFIGKELPVHNITWFDAIKFCNELSKIEGLDTAYNITGNIVKLNINTKGYRLPTEAEWEYACRGGSTGDYSGSGIIDEMGWYNANSGYKPHPSGQMKPNSYSLYDMHGNVWEWCWDWYGETYYVTSPAVDPLGPESGSRHVLRGGSFNDGPSFARSTNRLFDEKSSQYCGLRIVRNK